MHIHHRRRPATEPATEPAILLARRRRRRLFVAGAPLLVSGIGCGPADVTGTAGDAPAAAVSPVDVSRLLTDLADSRTLDGSANNLDHPSLGQVDTIYPRETPANYADGVSEPVARPNARTLSNRIFNDLGQNVFSETGVTHWSYVWGQFIDHTIGLRESSDDDFSIDFDPDDPLEAFENDLGVITMTRSAAAAGTGVSSPREQVNTVSSYIDAWAVYGGSADRLDWLRDGPVDGDPTNNQATLLDVAGYLPTSAARPGTEVPAMELAGRLAGQPDAAAVAGDIRANDNLGLTAVQTLFLREHNRIVDSLPDSLDQETKFEIARRVVGAEQQYITYSAFLPAMGVDLPVYSGYDVDVDPSVTNEFATVGYRAHSQIHGEFEAEVDRSMVDADQTAALEAEGVDVEDDGDSVELTIPLDVAVGNPGLLPQIGLGNMLVGLASESAYANDEQIDNQLRSVLFQVPGPDVTDPNDCLDGPKIADCFDGVTDLGAIDVMRGYDHGMPTYNDLREAYGLPRATSFTDVTGEDTEAFPDDPEIDPDDPIDDPSILDFVSLRDAAGNRLDPGSDAAQTSTVDAQRRSTTAARLAAIFDDVDDLDAFTGMVSEPHVPGTEFGPLQLAMWTRQFEALRDGDRFFYGNDPVLGEIADAYGIDFRQSLHDLIIANTDVDPAEVPDDVFRLAIPDQAASSELAATTPDPSPTPRSDDPTEARRPHRASEPPQRRRPGPRQPSRPASGSAAQPPTRRPGSRGDTQRGE